MRVLAVVAAVAILCGAAAAGPKAVKAQPKPQPATEQKTEQTWIAICFDNVEKQYTQTIGGSGFFHVGNGDRTYDTQKLVQSYYDGNMVCAVPDEKSPRAASAIAEICADRTTKFISVLYMSDTNTKRVIPKNATPYCRARIDVL